MLPYDPYGYSIACLYTHYAHATTITIMKIITKIMRLIMIVINKYNYSQGR